MTLLILALSLIGLCFVLVLARGAPYLPTLTPQVEAALELADLERGETLIELGCGDGKVLIAAAKQGLKVVGYELNPVLAGLCVIRTFKYRKNVTVIWGDFWQKPWPEAQAVFVFLLPKYMEKLNNKMIQLNSKPVKLISFAFEIPNKPVTAKKLGVFRYDYR